MRTGAVLGCHQMPERSFFWRDYQLPVCARCTGVFISAPIALVLFFIHRISIALAIALSFIMFVDWAIQRIGILESTNTRRLITGLLGGYGYMTLHFYLYAFIIDLIFG